ncbi:hypothetical protein ACIQV0_19120 [Lysinibacillus capsici]|uniref:DUF7687 domain-containing protein n=1 Tax=Lysinibacillus capsici TaxID=2115968 RepID=UPI003829FDF7
MKANPLFLNKSESFWGYVRILSKELGYSKKGASSVSIHTIDNAEKKLKKMGIKYDLTLLEEVIEYINYRANILNNIVQYKLMNLDEARDLYEKCLKIHKDNNFTCSLPLIKQKKEKRIPSYLTCMINILTELTLRNYCSDNNLIYNHDISFVDDPGSFTYILDSDGYIQKTFSRRFDGVYPSLDSPQIIWEIKEYYNTTSFGSRVADGVYESQLDGYEIKEFNFNLKHVFFLDAHFTWWVKGKSYLCRVIDLLHMGLVDEVVFGKELFEVWPDFLKEHLNNL